MDNTSVKGVRFTPQQFPSVADLGSKLNLVGALLSEVISRLLVLPLVDVTKVILY